MRYIKRLIYVLVVVLTGSLVALILYLTSLKPQYSGTVQLHGIRESVEIIFDNYGIPHIYAKNEEDAYFALGYVHAHERLFQMEMIRRVSSGSLSEIFGKEFIPVDKFFRTLGLDKHAAQSASLYLNDSTSRYQRSALAYIKGLNQFIRNGRTPLEFTLLGIPKKEYTPKDLYLTINYMAFNFAQGFKTDPVLSYIFHKYGPDYLKDVNYKSDSSYFKTPVYLDQPSVNADTLKQSTASLLELSEQLAPPLYGSNGWVIDSSKSRSGKVMLANDAHIGYSQPCVWYEAHLEYPGFSFYGNHLAGFPFAAIGHNKSVAWGLTMLMNDDVDFYSEKINPANKFEYWHDGKWERLKSESQTIHVKNDSDRTFTVRETVHGPLVQGVMPEWKSITDDAVACSWTHLKFPSNLLQVTYELNHSAGIDDARNAVSQIISPGLNVMYGDSSGNIAWWAAAKLIKRSPLATPSLLMNGSGGKYDVRGYFDFTSNPRAENPASGIVFTANNEPASYNGFSVPGYYVPDDRARRIYELLHDREKYGIDDFQRINYDVISVAASRNAQLIMSAIPYKLFNKTPKHNKAYYTLMRWNGDHQFNDVAPTIYYRLLYNILQLTLKDEMGTTMFQSYLKTHAYKSSVAALLKNKNSKWWDNINTKNKIETREQIFSTAFDMTVNYLVKNLDDNVTAWKWGRIHQLEHIHPIGMKKPFNFLFNAGPFPVQGGIETINNADFMLTEEPRYKVTLGPSMRIVLDFQNIENSLSILPTGESGNVMSSYYKDQATLYNNGKLRGQKMNRKDILQRKSGRLVIQPAH